MISAFFSVSFSFYCFSRSKDIAAAEKDDDLDEDEDDDDDDDDPDGEDDEEGDEEEDAEEDKKKQKDKSSKTSMLLNDFHSKDDFLKGSNDLSSIKFELPTKVTKLLVCSVCMGDVSHETDEIGNNDEFTLIFLYSCYIILIVLSCFFFCFLTLFS